MGKLAQRLAHDKPKKKVAPKKPVPKKTAPKKKKPPEKVETITVKSGKKSKMRKDTYIPFEPLHGYPMSHLEKTVKEAISKEKNSAKKIQMHLQLKREKEIRQKFKDKRTKKHQKKYKKDK